MKNRAHILVVGNAKGGSGKSTTAMHTAIRLMTLGYRVATLDLDSRQQTLAHYIQNRVTFATRKQLDLPIPASNVVHTYEDFCDTLAAVSEQHDVVIIDCPGSDTQLSRVAHSCADTLLTPMNDSFIDLDLLAHVDPDTHQVLSPSWYSEMIWAQRKKRFLKDQSSIDWLVIRNRLSHTDARNKRYMQQVLTTLAPQIHFRLGPSLGERVVFRELFLKGITLSDLRAHKTGVSMTMTHIAAHQEIKDLVHALKISPPHANNMTDLAVNVSRSRFASS